MQMGSVRVGAPKERIEADIMRPLQETEWYNRYILVVANYFSKWFEAYPPSNQEATTLAQAIVNEWVSRFGAPMALHRLEF